MITPHTVNTWLASLANQPEIELTSRNTLTPSLPGLLPLALPEGPDSFLPTMGELNTLLEITALSSQSANSVAKLLKTIGVKTSTYKSHLRKYRARIAGIAADYYRMTEKQSQSVRKPPSFFLYNDWLRALGVLGVLDTLTINAVKYPRLRLRLRVLANNHKLLVGGASSSLTAEHIRLFSPLRFSSKPNDPLFTVGQTINDGFAGYSEGHTFTNCLISECSLTSSLTGATFIDCDFLAVEAGTASKARATFTEFTFINCRGDIEVGGDWVGCVFTGCGGLALGVGFARFSGCVFSQGWLSGGLIPVNGVTPYMTDYYEFLPVFDGGTAFINGGGLGISCAAPLLAGKLFAGLASSVIPMPAVTGTLPP